MTQTAMQGTAVSQEATSRTLTKRINLLLSNSAIAWMNAESSRLKRQLGVCIGRSEMTRAVFGALEDAGINWGGCRSEAEIRRAFGGHLRRVAEALKTERAAAAGRKPVAAPTGTR
jgi:hypothetical protein